MTNQKRSEYFTRDSILGLLSDSEIERVTTAEEGSFLALGEEYIDLEELDQGVCVAKATSNKRMGNLLAKRAVQEKTWNAILSQLASRRIVPMRDGA